MSKVALKIENYTPDELLGLIRKDEKFSQAIRLFACYQVSLGKRPQDLEDLYGTTRSEELEAAGVHGTAKLASGLEKAGITEMLDLDRPTAARAAFGLRRTWVSRVKDFFAKR